MGRAALFAILLFMNGRYAAGQTLSVLHIKVAVLDAEQKAMPVPRHVLLVSDNPPSAPPRRIVTAPDGTADVRLRPGNYTVESDRAVTFQGKAYQWTLIVDVAAGHDAVLELTAGNAEIEAVNAATAAASAPLEADPSMLLPQWQESVVALWTPRTHASGFLIDPKGLIVTNQRVVGAATSVEVQLSPQLKVMATVLAADPVRDVAVLWMDANAAASLRPLPIDCAQAARPAVAEGQKLFTVSAPLREPKGMLPATVSRVDPRFLTADFTLASGSAGGPVFTAEGGLVGFTSVLPDENDRRTRGNARVVRIDEACDVLMSAEKKMSGLPLPDGTPLPIEPRRPFPMDALKAAAQRRAGSLNPYQMSTSDFGIAFITPVLAYAAQHPPAPATTQSSKSVSEAQPSLVRPLMDFADWSEYVADFPPVLLIRVTPKLVENFLTTVARGAARTQGVSLPPIKHAKTAFSRMRAFCGDTEVTPIHRFALEQRVTETDAIREGLYVFDPAALGPQCGPVKLALFSEKEPDKGDTRTVDPKVVEQIWQDFAAHREP